jgi:hypothetical protein
LRTARRYSPASAFCAWVGQFAPDGLLVETQNLKSPPRPRISTVSKLWYTVSSHTTADFIGSTARASSAEMSMLCSKSAIFSCHPSADRSPKGTSARIKTPPRQTSSSNREKLATGSIRHPMDVHAINLCRVCCGGHECFSLAADAWLCLSYLPARQVSALMCARARPSDHLASPSIFICCWPGTACAVGLRLMAPKLPKSWQASPDCTKPKSQ